VLSDGTYSHYYRFGFDHVPRQTGEFAPASDRELNLTTFSSWNSQLQHVRHWLGWVRQERLCPDLWKQLQQERDLAAELPTVDNNGPFTPDEQAQITQQLKEIKTHVAITYELPTEQLNAINGRLDYLTEAATRLERADFRTAMLGARWDRSSWRSSRRSRSARSS
jgi:hypothetical protein